MRRADRLFDIIQIMRNRKLIRAKDLAEQLEVSERTIYRDIGSLIASGVPVEGEAGIGYMLRKGFDLPPLMFNEEELEALVLGARIVESWTDPQLARAASNVISKVDSIIPEHLRRYMAETALRAPPEHLAEPVTLDIAQLRGSIRQCQIIHFIYEDEQKNQTERDVRPLGLAFYGPVWVLAAWCELRQDFRSFRVDRMIDFSVKEATFEIGPGCSLQEYISSGRP